MVRASLVPMLLVCGGLAAQTPQPAQAPKSGPVKQLSLREALQTSLQNNLQVDIAQQARVVTDAGIPVSEGTFDWNLSASAQDQRLEGAASGTLYTGSPSYKQTYTTYNRNFTGDLNKNFIWGGNLDFNYAPTYSARKSTVYNYYNPGNLYGATGNPYTGSLTATYTQSLLQGFGTEVTTAPMVIAKKNAEAADYTFQLAIINLVAQTEADYWAVVYAQKDLVNKNISLQLAQKQLNENMIRLKVGTMAPLDVTSAEAQVAQAEQNIISSQATLDNDKDTLIRDLYPNAERPAGLELTDDPTLSHIQLDEESAVKMALERRVELKGDRIAKDVSDLQLKVARNKVLPTLNAFVAYNGATDNYSGIGSVNSDLTGANYPGYTVGLKFAMPIQNRTAKGNLSIARANLRSSELTLRNQELTIILQVRTAVRNIQATEKGVKAAEKTRYLQEKTLEAEQKKFDNGMSTNFNVLQDMTNLDAARTAETQAQISYATAVTTLEQSVGNLLQARNFTIK
ncbi:MAG: TolC family protein [Holophaga sp.]|nr:TolC family protein [Holophaga sp.]